jgi:general stress protein YciG
MDQAQEPKAGQECVREERQRDPERHQELGELGGVGGCRVRQSDNRPDPREAGEEMQDAECERLRSELGEPSPDPERQDGAGQDENEDETVGSHRRLSLTHENTIRILGLTSDELEAKAYLIV